MPSGFRKRPWLTEARMFSATYTSINETKISFVLKYTFKRAGINAQIKPPKAPAKIIAGKINTLS